MPSMNPLRSIFGLIIVLLLGVGIGWALHALAYRPDDLVEGAENPVEEGTQVDEMLVSVTTTPATTGDLAVMLPVLGVVQAEPGAEYEITSRAAGRVTETL